MNRQAAVGAPGCLEGSSISCALVDGVSSVHNLCAKDQVSENCEQQVRYLADFLVGYEGDSLVGTFFPLLPPPVLQLLSPSMPLFGQVIIFPFLKVVFETIYLRLGLRPTWRGLWAMLSHSVMSDWDLSPVKTHGAWF